MKTDTYSFILSIISEMKYRARFQTFHQELCRLERYYKHMPLVDKIAKNVKTLPDAHKQQSP